MPQARVTPRVNRTAEPQGGRGCRSVLRAQRQLETAGLSGDSQEFILGVGGAGQNRVGFPEFPMGMRVRKRGADQRRS